MIMHTSMCKLTHMGMHNLPAIRFAPRKRHIIYIPTIILVYIHTDNHAYKHVQIDVYGYAELACHLLSTQKKLQYMHEVWADPETLMSSVWWLMKDRWW